MSTEENTNDAKKGGGYLKEKLLIGLTRFTSDEVERAVMKVTSHMLKAPNEKHMDRLIQATFGHYNSGSVDHGDVNRYIVEELEKRTHTHNWVVVLKSFVALHRLMTGGSQNMQRVLQGRMGLFSARNIKDLADSPEGAAQKSFIEQYIRYLEERNVVQYKLTDCGVAYRLEAEDFSKAIASMDMDHLAPVMALLLNLLEALVKIEFRPTIVDNFLTLEAYRYAVCDGKKLYQILSNRVLAMLELFEDFPLPGKQLWLKTYKRFDTAIKLLARLFDTMNRANVHWGESIPSLKLLPESLLRKLEDEVKYSDVKAEDIATLLKGTPASGEEQDRGPRVGSSSSAPPSAAVSRASDASPTEAQAKKAQPDLPPAPAPAPAAVSATAPRQDALDNLFGSPMMKPTTLTREALFSEPPPAPGSTSSSRQSPQPSSSSPAPDVWGQDVARPSAPRTVSPPRATPTAAAGPDFDPFDTAPAPARQQPAQPTNVDFFFHSSTPQQQYATRTNQSHTTATSAAPQSQAAPFSELANQGRGRAW